MSQPIIDAHQHFWTTTRNDYGWLTPEIGTLYQDYLPNDLKPILQSNHVVGTILVQAAPTVAETYYMLDLAKQQTFIKGVVGWVDLADINAIQDIQTLAKNPLFKGVRPMLQDLENPNWIIEATQSTAIQALIDHQLTLDLLIKTPHIPAALAFAKQWPQLKIVVDHCAKPDFSKQTFNAWQQVMQDFSALPNVYVKLSGLFESADSSLTAEQCQPYINTLLNTFTTDRIIWGSNWPVLTLWGSYQQWLEICKMCLAHLSEQQQQKVFYANANTFYFS